MQRILVTGGAGFIGSHLIDRLLADGHEVVCIDNLVLGRKENIAHHLQDKRFTFLEQDLLDLDALHAAFKRHKFTTVFHLAANSDIQASLKDTRRDLDLTFMTTFHVLEAMRVAGVQDIVFSSTSAIYGNATPPISEDQGPLFPVSLYGASKLASEGYISTYCDNFGMRAWIVRFPNVVGERTTHGILHDFVKKLRADPRELEVLGDGKQRKPYIYVKDLIETIMFIWQGTHDKLNWYLISPDDETTVARIAEMVIAEMGLHAKIKYTGGAKGWTGDVPFYSYDTGKLKALGWTPQRSSDDAVRVSIRHILGK